MRKILLTSLIASAVVINGINLSFAEEQNTHKHSKGNYAQGQGHSKHKHMLNEQGKPVKPGAILSKKLNLTPEQEAKAKAMRESSRDKIKPLFDDLRSEKEKLTQMKQAGASQQELQKQLEKIHSLKLRIKEIHQNNLGEFEKILNNEQKTEFQKIKEQRKQMMQERREKFKQGRSVK